MEIDHEKKAKASAGLTIRLTSGGSDISQAVGGGTFRGGKIKQCRQIDQHLRTNRCFRRSDVPSLSTVLALISRSVRPIRLLSYNHTLRELRLCGEH